MEKINSINGTDIYYVDSIAQTVRDEKKEWVEKQIQSKEFIVINRYYKAIHGSGEVWQLENKLREKNLYLKFVFEDIDGIEHLNFLLKGNLEVFDPHYISCSEQKVVIHSFTYSLTLEKESKYKTEKVKYKIAEGDVKSVVQKYYSTIERVAREYKALTGKIKRELYENDINLQKLNFAYKLTPLPQLNGSTEWRVWTDNDFRPKHVGSDHCMIVGNLMNEIKKAYKMYKNAERFKGRMGV